MIRVSYSRPLTDCVRPGAYIRGNRLYFPAEGVGIYAQIIDAAAQTAGAAAAAASGQYKKEERSAANYARGKTLELGAERTMSAAALEVARIQTEALRAGGTAEAKAAAAKTKYIIAGAAGLGVLALLGIVLLR